MNYYIRLNGDDSRRSNTIHSISTEGETVTIRDTVTFPMSRERVYVREVELVGEDGVVYAFRRIPPDSPFVPYMDATIQLSFDWRLHLTVDGKNRKEST